MLNAPLSTTVNQYIEFTLLDLAFKIENTYQNTLLEHNTKIR